MTGGQLTMGAKDRGAKDRGAKDRGANDRGANDRNPVECWWAINAVESYNCLNIYLYIAGVLSAVQWHPLHRMCVAIQCDMMDNCQEPIRISE